MTAATAPPILAALDRWLAVADLVVLLQPGRKPAYFWELEPRTCEPRTGAGNEAIESGPRE